jgi:L,D-transpeptidase catalytic domain
VPARVLRGMLAEKRGLASVRVRVAAWAAAMFLCAAASAKANGLAPANGGGATSASPRLLSNLHGLSRWAYPQTAGLVHRDPSVGSRVVGRLHLVTGDGQAQVYLALRSEVVDQVTWMQLPVPGRPNGMAGWVPASDLSELHVTREYLRVNRETLRAELYRGTRAIWGASVGVGRSIYPTPAGNFYVTEKLIPLDEPFYGPYALVTSAYAPTLSEWPGGGVVGIHGTDEPGLVPGRPSHGCIRLHNADIAKLWRLIEVGTPIEIV